MSEFLIAAKAQLDKVIKQARVHFYKPTQIAEILRHHRENPAFNLSDLESYRKDSMHWRDEVSLRLVGRICTSTRGFQNDFFGSRDAPPEEIVRLITILAEENERLDRAGIVEAYIYRSIIQRMDTLKSLREYIANSNPESFSLVEFLNGFRMHRGLKRSIDKAYEITVYALFNTVVRHLRATVTLKVPSTNIELLEDFEDFTEVVLGVNVERSEITVPARLFRAGVANAADRGLDMWANFGPAVQVKHLSLTEDTAEDIVEQISADKIVIVCLTAEKTIINRILTQLGFSKRIQGIITQDDLERWYSKCFSEKYKDDLGIYLLEELHREFLLEFPSIGNEFINFMEERRYDQVNAVDIFAEE